jgi:predicted MFS family arabinose efflux permease
MMLSLCTKYFHFILVQGLVIGISTSMIQLPAFAATSQFFDKKRGAALGIVVSGSSIGGVIFPIAFSKMLNDSTLGFGWSVRVMGFAVIPLVVFASLTMRARLPPRKTNFLLPSAFRDRKYVCLVVALALMFLGMNTPIYFIPTYAVSKGVDPVLASYLIAIINGSSTFGRIIPGFLADKLGRFNVFAFGGVATGVCILCLNHIEGTPGLVAYCVFFGFSSGMIISGGSTALTVCAKNPQDFGTYMGMGMAAASVSVLIGPPINGALIDRYNGYNELAIFSGVVCLVGGCVATISKTSMPGGVFGRS